MTADYKALCMLMKKKQDESADECNEWTLGGKGLDTEFCIYCLAVRVSLFLISLSCLLRKIDSIYFCQGCGCKETNNDGACMGCLKDCFTRSKANIGKYVYIPFYLDLLKDYNVEIFKVLSESKWG